jgi:hypothetical protein
MGQKFFITEQEKIRIKSLYVESMETPEDQQLDKILAQAGVTLTPDEKKELSPGCPLEEPPSQHAEVIDNIKSKIELMDLSNLVKTLSQVKSLIGKKPQPVQEQIAPILIAGIAVPGVAVAIVAGFIALIIVIKIAKLISRGGRPKPACARRRRLVRKFGLEGNFM